MMDKILQTAHRTLDIEIQTLSRLRESLNFSFQNAVQNIYAARGRVIVTGIGKSAIVAQKIVATFNSTGTPSVFMHAADAIHGDLGIVQSSDIIICLSKSGDTPEIKVLVPLLKTFGSQLIAIVSNLDSYLAKQADCVLHTPIEQEADPNNLAPTASTTAQMVMGDMLATALLAQRGFSAADFAQYHPGGALGKQLYLRVRDIYPLHGTPSVFLDDNLKKTILEMTSQRLGAAVVLNAEKNISGIITDGDLRRLLLRDLDLKTVRAADVMTPAPLSIPPDTLAVEALRIMRERKITQLIVSQDGAYLGMVHLHDLLREGLGTMKQ